MRFYFSKYYDLPIYNIRAAEILIYAKRRRFRKGAGGRGSKVAIREVNFLVNVAAGTSLRHINNNIMFAKYYY